MQRFQLWTLEVLGFLWHFEVEGSAPVLLDSEALEISQDCKRATKTKRVAVVGISSWLALQSQKPCWRR